MPIILIAISITVFFTFTNPIYSNITTLKAQAASYNTALDNEKALEGERDVLTSKYNAINPDDLDRLQKLLPDNVDNIRLILEIGQIALPYGMTLTDVKYDTGDTSANSSTSTTGTATTPAPTTIQGGAPSGPVHQDYGVLNLSFSTSGTYDNFINFTKDLESNLRMIDISSIQFSSDIGSSASVGSTVTGGATKNASTANTPEVYKYDFQIQTYWLKG